MPGCPSGTLAVKWRPTGGLASWAVSTILIVSSLAKRAGGIIAYVMGMIQIRCRLWCAWWAGWFVRQTDGRQAERGFEPVLYAMAYSVILFDAVYEIVL